MTTPPADIRSIHLDVDGTIFPTEEDLPAGFHENLSILSRLIERANAGEIPKIGFCTGRELNYIEGATRAITRSNYWSVLENGLCLINLATQARINSPRLTPEAREAFRKIRDAMPTSMLRFPSLELYDKKEVHLALDRRWPSLDLEAFLAPLAEALVEFQEFVTIVSSGIAIDILVKGVDKGTGLQELCKWEHISPQQTLVIGDSPNDFPAMALAGFVGCPSNATARCKEFVGSRGGHVSLLPYVVGVVDIIRHYIPNARQV